MEDKYLTLEQKLELYAKEDILNSENTTFEEFGPYYVKREKEYMEMLDKSSLRVDEIYNKIIEPLQIKPIYKRDFKLISTGIIWGILSPLSIIGLLGYTGYKSIFKIEPKHGDKIEMMAIAMPIIALHEGIKELVKPIPLAYKITNKEILHSEINWPSHVALSTENSNCENFNPDYIESNGQEFGRQIKLHFTDNTCFSLSNGFKQFISENKKTSKNYFLSNVKLIEELKKYSGETNLIEKNLYNLSKIYYKKTNLSLRKHPENWVKATVL